MAASVPGRRGPQHRQPRRCQYLPSSTCNLQVPTVVKAQQSPPPGSLAVTGQLRLGSFKLAAAASPTGRDVQWACARRGRFGRCSVRCARRPGPGPRGATQPGPPWGQRRRRGVAPTPGSAPGPPRRALADPANLTSSARHSPSCQRAQADSNWTWITGTQAGSWHSI